MEVQGPRRFSSTCCTNLLKWISWCSSCGSSRSYGQSFLDEEQANTDQAFSSSAPSVVTNPSPSRSSPTSDRQYLLPKAAELNSSSNVWTDGKPPTGKWGAETGKLELKKDKMGDLVKGYPSGLSIATSEEGEFCSTCLEPYTPENPAIWTKCNHHFHLACIYEWLERKQTCPICEREMSFEEILE